MKQYFTPLAELLKLSSEDIMSLSPGLNVGGEGDSGGGFDFGDLESGSTRS